MKKIFAIFAAACALVACDPVQEDFKNDGHITLDELRAKTKVVVDHAASGKNGNVITCETLAPVNAKWTIGGKEILGNYAWKKMKLGEHNVCLEALCPDGTVLYDTVSIKCEEITNALERFYIYQGEPLVLNPGDAAAGRFSDNEGKGLPYLTDDVYWGFKTLVFDVLEANPGNDMWDGAPGPTRLRVMNGWWSAVYADDVFIEGPGLWELPLTEAIAKDCARGNGGQGKDLDLLVRGGSLKIGSVYYEE